MVGLVHGFSLAIDLWLHQLRQGRGALAVVLWLHQLRQGKAAADPHEGAGPAATEGIGAVGATIAMGGSIAPRWPFHL